MTENDTVEEPSGAEVIDKTSGAGTILRTAREAQGLHIAMLAVSLKVPVKKLEALEADRFDLLPDMVFVRALAASVCRSLKIDSAPVLAALPRSQQPQIKTGESGLNAVFEDASGVGGHALMGQLRKPLGITVAVVIVGILSIVFLPEKWLDSSVFADLSAEEKSLADAQATEKFKVTDPAVSTSAPGLAQVVQDSTPSVDESVSPAVKPLTQSPIAYASSPASSIPPITVASDRSGMNLFTLRGLGESWVEVVDAKGVLQLRKTLHKDEVISLAGALPLSVVLGRADMVSVSVRGKPLDTLALAKDHVARFEVK